MIMNVLSSLYLLLGKFLVQLMMQEVLFRFYGMSHSQSRQLRSRVTSMCSAITEPVNTAVLCNKICFRSVSNVVRQITLEKITKHKKNSPKTALKPTNFHFDQVANAASIAKSARNGEFPMVPDV